jgi:hypothetical protein
MKLYLLMSLIFFFLIFANSVKAMNEIWTADINGTSKRSFTTLETVYAAGNMASVNSQILLCVVNDTNTWSNGTRINDTTGSCKSANTNGTGYFFQLIWANPKTGSYDLVADLNQDGYYETDTDYVWNATTTGFVVTAVSKPILTVGLGPNNPVSHSCDAENLTSCSNNVMMQIKLTADSTEDINFTSISLISSGTGNDKTSIKRVLLVEDVNNTGKFNAGENIYASSKFFSDNSTTNLQFDGSYRINLSSSVYFKIVYDFVNGSAGDTYMFQVIAISAKGATTGQIPTINGLPIESATKTMKNATATSSTTTTTNNTALTIVSNETTTTAEAAKNIFGDYILIIVIIVIVAIAAVAIYFILKGKKEFSEQKLERKKEEDLTGEDLFKDIK